jgi:hypothetical protein
MLYHKAWMEPCIKWMHTLFQHAQNLSRLSRTICSKASMQVKMGNEQFGPSIKMHQPPSSSNQMEVAATRCMQLHAPCNMVHPGAIWSKHFIASCLQQNTRCNVLGACSKVPWAAQSFSQAHVIVDILIVNSSIQMIMSYIWAYNIRRPSNSWIIFLSRAWSTTY